MMLSNSVEEMLLICRGTINAAEFSFFFTHGENNYINARLMQGFEPDDDLTIWFGTSPKTRKVKEILIDNRITLGYGYPSEGAYITLKGKASIEVDVELRVKYWRETFEEFWPLGPEGDDYVLIKFVPEIIEIMNLKRGVAPEPYGLKPMVLIREENTWSILAEDYLDDR